MPEMVASAIVSGRSTHSLSGTSTHAIYLIGAGAIGRHHVASIPKLAGAAVLAGVADPNEEVLSSFSELHPDVPAFTSAAEMLAHPPGEDDVVVVATPPWTHGELSIRALEAGHHVLCEKPFAIDVPTAAAMAQAANRANRLIGCCSCRFLGLPTTEAVVNLLAAGEVGQPYRVTFIHRSQRRRSGVEYQPETSWFLNRELSGGGVLCDLGPYDLALLNELLRPEAVTIAHAWQANPRAAGPAPGAVFDVEEHIGATLLYRLANGAEVIVTYERAACTHGGERQVVELEGMNAAVTWDWLMLRGGSVTVTVDREGTAASTEHSYAARDELGMHDRPLAYFLRKVRGQDAPIPVNDEAVFNLECLRAIYDAAETGAAVSVQRVR
jgi:predicted dehydrogenase